MPKYMKNFITLAGLIIMGSFLAFLYNCISGLADFAGRINPEFGPWVFWVLFLAVAGMLGWALAVAFIRPRPMMVYADPTDEDLAEFQRMLMQRLRKNRNLRSAGIAVRSDEDLEAGLAFLKSEADEEIRATAKRVFIGTAVSQNGRLDTLVVLFLITRLAWRIAKIYNQRPHYRELINLYANIAATSFLAGSIEEFGIEEYVRELMGPLVGGSAIGAVPGAQAIASTITASVLTGSTNCLLALRCGVVARDYLSLNLDAKGAMRRSATIEASKMFVSMSAETVTYVTRALVKGSTNAAKAGGTKFVKGVGGAISGTAVAVGSGTRMVGRGVKGTAGSVGRGVQSGAGSVGRGVKSGADSVGKGMRNAAGSIGQGVKRVKDTAKDRVGKAVETIQSARESLHAGTESVVEKTDSLIDAGREKARTLVAKLKRTKKKQ